MLSEVVIILVFLLLLAVVVASISGYPLPIMEISATIALLAVVGGLVKLKVDHMQISKIAETMKELKEAQKKFLAETGSLAFAPRCFLDNKWISYPEVCGDPEKWTGPYTSLKAGNWIDCLLSPTSQQKDKKGCFSPPLGNTYEITNSAGIGKNHKAITVTGLRKQDAYDIFNYLVGNPLGTLHPYPPADEKKGVWVEPQKDNDKYSVFMLLHNQPTQTKSSD